MTNRTVRNARALITLSALISVACDAGESGKGGHTGATLPPYTAKDARFDPNTVFAPAKAPPPISGGTLAVMADGRVVAADSDRDLIYVIDPAHGDVDTIKLGSGDEPGRVVTDATQAFVALRGAGGVARVDLKTLALTRTAVCSAPRGLAFSGKDALLVACAGGELVTLNLDGSERTRTFVHEDLRDIGRDKDGLWASLYRRPALLRLNENAEIQSESSPGIVSIAGGIDPSGMDTFSATLAVRTISTAAGPVMLHQRAQDTAVDVLSGPDSYGGAGFNECEAGIVHATLSRFGGEAIAPALPLLPGSVVPVDVAVSPDGTQLAVVSPGSFSRQRAPLEVNPGIPVSAESSSGSRPGPTRQLALLSANMLSETPDPQNPCFVDATQAEHVFPGEAVAVAFVTDKRLVVQLREPAELRVLDADEQGHMRLKRIVDLSKRSVMHTGHQLFHQAAGVSLACASCHGEGHDDHHTWQFQGIGARRTQSLLDDVLASAPFHWSGDITDLGDLMNQVFVNRMGGEPVNQPWTDALAKFMEALPERVYDAPVRDAAAVRGETAFQTAECSTCHFGPAYGRSGAFDVGTGGTFQVPSLVGVSTRLPLMHNGCALTLEGRFDPTCGGAQHGRPDLLSAEELADLIAFLKTL